MKVIVSAIACAPGEGSEGGVGWAAVLRIARHHDVRVLAHAQSTALWKQAQDGGRVPPNVRVRFLGKNQGWHPNRLVARGQSWLRFLDFNRRVLAAAREWHSEEPCDLVHQVTYATWRVPSPLWKMPVPFVWGPIGGAATIPDAFLGMLSREARAVETARTWQSRWAVKSSDLQQCVTKAAVVLAANEETERFLRPHRGAAPMLRLPVAYLPPEKVSRFERPIGPAAADDAPLSIFAGGNIEGRKGVSLALQALAKVKASGVKFHYTVAGGGPELPKLQGLVESLGLAAEVTFHPGYRGDDYVRALHAADLYLLPSFRETTPVTLQEAILGGCYPVVADASAAGEMVRMVGGTAVAADTPAAMVDGLAAALIRVAGDRSAFRAEARAASRRVADHFSGDRYGEVIEQAYRIATTIGVSSAKH